MIRLRCLSLIGAMLFLNACGGIQPWVKPY